MRKRVTSMLSAAGILVLVGTVTLVDPRAASAQRPPAQVEVVNPATAPVQTRDVDHPARQPFQASAGVDVLNGQFAGVASFTPAIPTGKIFVIELVSANVAMPTGQRGKFILFVDNGAVGLQYHFGLSFVATDAGTVDHLEAQHPTRLYQAPATSGYLVNFTRFDNQGDVRLVVNLSGHLVDQ